MRGNIGRILSIVATAILMVPTTVAQSRENPPTPGTAVLGVRSAKSYAQLAPNTTTGGIQEAIDACAEAKVPCSITIDPGYIAEVKTPITVNIAGVSISGGGYASKIRVMGAGDVFTVSAPLFQLQDLEVTVAETASRANAAIVHASTATAGQGFIFDVRFTGNTASPNNGSIFVADAPSAGLWQIDHIRVPGGTTWASIAKLTSKGPHSVASNQFSHVQGNAHWSEAAFVLDGFIDTVQISDIDLAVVGGGGGTIIWAKNTVGAATNPRWIECKSCNIEGGLADTSVRLDASRYFSYSGYIAGSSVGVAVGSGAVNTDLSNTVFASIQKSAVTIADGAIHTQILGNFFDDSGCSANNSYDTISIAPNAKDFQILFNHWRVYGCKNLPRYAIDVPAGTSNSYAIVGNDIPAKAVTTGAISNGGTGGTSMILGNTAGSGVESKMTIGFSGTKKIGSCVLTISNGIITNVTGC